MSDHEQYLRTDQVTGDLRRTAVRGGTVTMIAQLAKFALTMGGTMILARLLTPADFGLVAMVLAISGFVSMFKDLGLSMATVQRAEITHAQVSTLFWINLAVGAVLFLLLAGLSPAVAWFYGEPRLTAITIAFGSAFLCGGLTVQHQALLRRQMRFLALAGIEVAALAIGIGSAVAAAWAGAGYWALVLRQIAIAAATAGGVWLLCGWRPGRPARRSGVRAMLAFGGHLTGFGVVNYLARNVDKALIGWRAGANPLGLYSKAYQLLLLPIYQINAPVSSVAIPTLSRLQDDPERYRRYYCNAINLLAYVTTPLVVAMAVLAEEMILIVLGPQWLGAANLFRVMAIAAIGQPISNTTGWIFISLGRGRRMFQWGLLSTPLFLLSFAIGLHWGALGVAAGYAACATLLRFPGFWFAFRGSPLRLGQMIGATWRPTVISLAMLIVMAAARLALDGASLLARLLVPALLGAILFALAVRLWPRARAEVRKLFEVARSLRTEAAQRPPAAINDRDPQDPTGLNI